MPVRPAIVIAFDHSLPVSFAFQDIRDRRASGGARPFQAIPMHLRLELRALPDQVGSLVCKKLCHVSNLRLVSG